MTINYIMLFQIAVLMSSISQVLLKISAMESKESKIKEYLNFKVIFSYTLLFLAMLITTFAYRVIPLSWGAVLESFSYMYILILAYLIFKEKISKRKLLGVSCIVSGIILFYM